MIPARIDAVVSDVDGVLTDGRLLHVGRQAVAKPFHVRDGEALRALQHAGVAVLWLTARDDAAMHARAEHLGVAIAVAAPAEAKPRLLSAWLAERGVAAAQTVYIGDGISDLAPMADVGWPVAVADAHPRARQAARRLTRQPGGAGAFAEVAAWVLARRTHG